VNGFMYPLLVLAGFAAGFINTLAGSGSVVSLAALDMAGLPLDVANGTNRIAILLQNVVGVSRFRQQGTLTIRPHLGIIMPAVAGGIAGAFIAGQVNREILRTSVGVCMLVVLVLLFMKPKRWLQGRVDGRTRSHGPVQVVSFFLVGLYGGYIQLGVGVFLLTALVMAVGFDLVRGNAIKVLIVLCFTIPVLGIFLMNGLVRWDAGLTLAAGNMLGAWAATHESAKRGTPFIRWLLIGVTAFAAVRYLLF
jgi:uncharacterized membrane protein YfcA